jgi:phosphatidylserine decarboxylase
MTLRSFIARISQQEDLNFLLTNHIPRAAATRFMGWFSKIEQPLVRDLSIAVWRLFSDLDLREAKKTRFTSMHDCFIRELKDGVRPIDADPSVLVSPCDAIVGACGPIEGVEPMQIKGSSYMLDDLLRDSELVDLFRNGTYATLRLTSSMYHRFHAPCDCRVEQVNYISGDMWNVNPIALKRVPKLFCKNERAVIRCRDEERGHVIALVPVAAILVASIRLHFLNVLLDQAHKGPRVFSCDTSFRKGEEMGWFQHGSTIIVFAPQGFALCEGIGEGTRIRVGERLMNVA